MRGGEHAPRQVKAHARSTREKGLVTYRKEGKARIYRITKEGLNVLIKLREAYNILRAVGLEK